MFEPNMQRRKDLVTLREFVAVQEAGARVSWVEVAQATGGVMVGPKALNLFRKACKQEKRDYLSLPDVGVEFSGPANAIECVQRSIGRIAGAVKSAAEKSGRVIERHAGEMPAEQASELIRLGSFASMLAIVAKLKASESASMVKKIDAEKAK